MKLVYTFCFSLLVLSACSVQRSARDTNNSDGTNATNNSNDSRSPSAPENTQPLNRAPNKMTEVRPVR